MTAGIRILHTHRLQFPPLQVPQLLQDHPGETAATEMIVTGMAIAAVRILHHFHWHFVLSDPRAMHFLAFFITSSSSLGIPACLDHKIALDACCPYLETRS